MRSAPNGRHWGGTFFLLSDTSTSQPTTQSQSPGPFDHESDNLLMFHVSLFNFSMDEIPPGQHHVLEIVCSPLHVHFRNSVLGVKAIEILLA